MRILGIIIPNRLPARPNSHAPSPNRPCYHSPTRAKTARQHSRIHAR
ncbi:hypothetical protein [Moraxella lacunata]